MHLRPAHLQDGGNHLGQGVCEGRGNCYSHKAAESIHSEPAWPRLSFEELMALAFDGKIISDKDDPLLRRLMGKE